MKQYVLVGTGNRGYQMYATALTGPFAHAGQLVGVYDTNAGRAQLVAAKCNCPSVESFDALLALRPDCVIVTSVDATHHIYILQALRAGCDVISEKPMTTTAEACREILAAERATGHRVRVGFNLRYAPFALAVKQALQQGVVGEIYSIHFEWLLDTSHGADYFRRWHRYMCNSAGLLIHKASHHFDLANWYMDSAPARVYASGKLRFYGNQQQAQERCLTCPPERRCPYYWDITSDAFCKEFYLEQEQWDGYYRDRCVFAPDIDIYDTVSATVTYANGSSLAYSLTAHSPYEGWRMQINGALGRLEAQEISSGPEAGTPFYTLFDRKGQATRVEVPHGTGGHGGADDQIRQDLFVGGGDDPWHQRADSLAGAYALLIGVAANQSIATGQPQDIQKLAQMNSK